MRGRSANELGQYWYSSTDAVSGGGRPSSTYDLVQTLGGTETSRSHTNDEDVNLTAAETLMLAKDSKS